MHQDLPMIKGAHFIYDGDFAIHSRIKEDSSIRIQKIYEPKTQRTDKWAGTYRFLNQQKSGAQTGIRDHLLGEEEQNKDALEYYKRWQDMSTRLDQVKDVQNSVFIFLHVEPEATVNPSLVQVCQGRLFTRLIRRCVHKSIPIYIKEHPAMFLAAWEDKKANYNAYRGLPILSEISRLPNCRLLDAEVKTEELLQQQPICASIMGTIQSEALMKGSPLISSQSGPLKGAEGVSLLTQILNPQYLIWSFSTGIDQSKQCLLNNDQYVSDIVSRKAFKGRQMQH